MSNDDGTNGQDRESYTDTQDRDSYTVQDECVGCGGTDMPLNADEYCACCVALDAEVDEYGPDW